jgi:hypothetical protein
MPPQPAAGYLFEPTLGHNQAWAGQGTGMARMGGIPVPGMRGLLPPRAAPKPRYIPEAGPVGRIPKVDGSIRTTRDGAAKLSRYAAAPATYTGAATQGQEFSADFTLRTHLRELQKVELGRIVLIRKISKLGFDSAPILEKHYSRFGKVEKVLVAHSHVKPQHCGQGVRLRPSGLGFVVMSQPQQVEAILAAGEHQVVQGVRVCVRKFERRGVQDDEDQIDEEVDEDQID